MAIEFYVSDTETTGLQTKMHEIFQFSFIRASDRVQLTREIRVEKPELASYDALRVTGKTLADLDRGITKLQAIRDLEEFLAEDGVEPSHRCLVLHNSSFDRRFFWAMWEKFGKSFPFHLYLDTIPMFKDFKKKNGMDPKSSCKLEDACNHFSFKKYGASHNAETDTRHTFLLWQELSKTIDFMDHIQRLPHNLDE